MFLLQFDLPLFSFAFNFKNCRCLNENLLGTLFCQVFLFLAKVFEVADFNWSFLNCNVLRETHGLVDD